jgi:esterase/lipase superfamily enzyme
MAETFYVITNRRLFERRDGMDIFGRKPAERTTNEKGPNELRAVKVVKDGHRYDTDILPDQIKVSEARAIKRTYDLDIDPSETRWASLEVAAKVYGRAVREKKNVLLYVHGYNNDVEDVIDTCAEMESLYDIIVVPFCWPANGGGAISGTTAYLSDKQDARASADALNRVIGIVRRYFGLFTQHSRDTLLDEARQEFPNNRTAALQRFAELLDEDCTIKVSMLCHSMGNYLLKHALRPGGTASRELTFDNICLVAADANNLDHEDWVDKMDVRNRLYITINENDYALGASRAKPGNEQLARLGHYLRGLYATTAYYIDVTKSDAVRRSHGYYIGKPVERNPALKAFFAAALGGGSEEKDLTYHADLNAYRLP